MSTTMMLATHARVPSHGLAAGSSRASARLMMLRCIRWAVLFLAGLTLAPTDIFAQRDMSYPKRDYYFGAPAYAEGDFATAARIYRQSASGGLRSVEGRWVDSICYHAMLGECLYQMGKPADALEQFNAAVKLYIQHNGWLLRVQFPVELGPTQRVLGKPPTWGRSTRRTQVAHIPDKFQAQLGNIDNRQAAQQGGVVQPARLILVAVPEVMRCLAVAMRRRAEIMGPICEHDRLTDQLLETIATRQAPQGHWVQSWIDCLMGLAYLGDNKPVQAASELQKSLQLGGKYDHPLTPTALLELGKIAFQQGNLPQAGTLFLEASYSAAYLQQYDILAEALRMGHVAHEVKGEQGIYPPLLAAAAWSKRESRYVNAVVTTCAAEALAARNDTRRANALLGDATAALARQEMKQGRVGADFLFAKVAVDFRQGKIAEGNQTLQSLLKFQQASSLWLYQINLADALYRGGGVTPRVAALLYEQLLREPTAKDWATQPLETISLIKTPHPLPLEHWFEVMVERKEHDRVIDITDRIRRHRFHSSLPMGGRLLALRWVLDAPVEAISRSAALQRQDLLAKFPAYGNVAQQANASLNALNQMPLAPADQDGIDQQTSLFKDLGEASTAQELLIRQLSVARVPSEFAFPPLADIRALQGNLPAGTHILSFLSTSRGMYGFLISQETYGGWRLESPAKLRRQVSNLLRAMGNYGDVSQLSGKELQDTEWRQAAAELFQSLIPAEQQAKLSETRELVIVPDSFLWYVPFEALQQQQGGTSKSLLSQFTIRYGPTVSLTLPDQRGFKPRSRTAVVVDKLFPRDDIEVATEAFEQLSDVLPDCERIPDPLQVPSALFAAAADRLITYADIPSSRTGPYDWSPITIDRNKGGSQLDNWMSLPFAAPNQVILPGYHTAAESSLKSNANGEEVFLSVCGLMATGARTVLLSRWRPGGQTSFELVREFAQELPHRNASQAWRRSVELTTPTELQPDLEPRISGIANGIEVTAEHPFFWSGYMLIDTGASPAKD